MVRTQIYLTEKERDGLASLARGRNQKQSELIREAIDSFLESQEDDHRRASLSRLAGLWRSRCDLPDFAQLRQGWDRAERQ